MFFLVEFSVATPFKKIPPAAAIIKTTSQSFFISLSSHETKAGRGEASVVREDGSKIAVIHAILGRDGGELLVNVHAALEWIAPLDGEHHLNCGLSSELKFDFIRPPRMAG